MTPKKITDVPTNVKEAIDWLIRIGELDTSTSNGNGKPNNANCTALYKAIKALTGSQRSLERDIKGLIEGLAGFLDYSSGTINGGGIIKKGGSSYTSAYKEGSAQWPTCSKGGTCSCCQGSQGSCNCTVSPPKSCDGQCCNRCDIRICAGIFVALVPALHTALDGLKNKLKEKGQQKIHEDPIKEHFTALGYKDDQLNSALTASTASSKLINATAKLKSIKENINNAFDSKQSRPTQNGFTATDKSISTSNGTSTPTSIREMLLWLMGLPYCQNYKDFVEALKKRYDEQNKSISGSSTSSRRNQDANPLAKQLSAVIFHLPTVFYSIEGRISYLKEIFEQFKDKAKPRFCYPTEGDKLLNTLSAYVAVCYPILKYLMQRCDKETRGRVRRGTGAGTTPTDEKDGSWGDLLVSGNENNTGQETSRGASGSSAPQTALRDYLVFMGFKTGNGTVTGDDLYEKALAECFSPNVKDDEDDDKDATTTGLTLGRSSGRTSSKNYQKLPALRKLAKHVLQEAHGPAGAGGGAGGVSSPTTPTTIRQMMLWLIGLPLTEAYKSSSTTSSGTGALFGKDGPVLQGINNNPALKELEKGQLNGRRITSTATATGKHFKQQLKDSIVGMIMLFQRIEGGLGSVVEFLKEGFKDKSGGGSSGAAQGNGKFKYDGKTILNVFSSYVYKVHTQLRFLKVMCTVGKGLGGWNHCIYGGSNQIKNDVTGIRCQCSGTKYTGECHHPLQHFLTDDDKEKSLENRFKHGSNLVIMGFSSERLPSQRTEGSHIHTYLEQLLDPIPTTPSSPTTPSKPLSLLTQYCVAIGPLEPESLGDHIDVFRELAGDGMWSKIQTQVKESVKGITKDDESGQGASGRLQQALQAVWPSSHNGGAHDGDLRSLTGCNGGAPNCTPFVASLSHGLYKYCDPSKLDSPANKIDWLYMKMSALYGKLVTLKTEMTEKCKCCPNGETKPTGCNGITQCPNCLPLLYKMGLVFGDPVTISTNKCSELMEKMKKVLDATSKLCVVFKSIDDKRFWPYLLFSAMVVQSKSLQVKKDGDDNYNCYTHALGGEYKDTYLEVKKKELEKTAQENKKARDEKLKCTCTKHEYSELKVTPKNPIIVTLTLYFKSTHITQTISLTVPFHGPAFNPLVRLYPRNLKSIVDWILRIGQTRLGQDGSGASTNDTGLKEMCETFWPKIQECLKEKDDNSKGVFKGLVTNVMSLMGLKNQGNKEVGQEVKKALKEVTEKLNKKLNGSGEGFQQTFTSILTFNPKDYIDKVIEDFGERVCKVQTNGQQKPRDFNCIAKAVSTCMNKALQTIKKLATENKEALTNYNVKHIEGLETINDTVSTLNDLSTVEKLFKCFKTFFTSYENVLKVLGSGLQQAQDDNNDRKTLWEAIQKYTGAFYYVSEVSTHVSKLKEENSIGESFTHLLKLIDKLKEFEEYHKDMNESTTEKVTQFIEKVKEKLTEIGKENIEKALNIKNGSTTFDDVVKMFLSTVLSRYPNNANVIDKIFYHLPVFSECLKAMVEIYNTGMKEFIKELKTCLETAKGHINKIHVLQMELQELKDGITYINDGTKDNYKDDGMTFILQKAVESIKELLSNHYIYQTQPIVDTLIDTEAVQKMTNYLKSLPDLIRDRYVLQKWNDKPEDFCGVQEFKGGIVKQTDTDGITTVLQDLLRDTFHDQTTYCVTIHEFQVRALIYNFCHKEAMEQTGSGVMLLYHINYHINGAQGTPQSQASLQWTNIKDKKEKLSPLLTKLSDNAYLRYFATHLRDSVGYHTLSNTLGALEKVKEKLKESNGSSQPDKWNEFKDLLQKTAIDELYNRLSSLLDKLHREYIFEYPPFDWQKSCQKLMRKQDEAEKAAQTGRQRRSTDAQAAPSPKATTPNTCEMCVPSMAHIFVGFVPQMYRLFKMLREIAQKEKQSKSDTLLNADNVQDILTKTLTVAGFFECEGWRLKLGSDMTKDVEVFPFDLEHSKTGDDLCKFLDDIITDKEPGALVAQGEASTTDSLKPLDKLFQAVMQHFRKKRDELRKKREKALEDEFNKKHKDSGLTFQAPPAPLPSTVRQVLFWLHEMDTNKAFYDQMSQHIEALCHQSSIDITPSTILHVLKLSITQCLEVLATIEDPGRQNADYYYELYTEEHYYDYPVTNIPLFFYTFVEKLMAAFLELNFVCVQCEFTGKQGGWKDCHIGKSEHSMEGQNCRCTKSHTTVSSVIRVSVEGSVVCPRPLSAFLFSDPKNQLRIPSDVSQRLAYMSKGTMPCGFQLKNKASTDAATPGDAHTHTPLPTSVTGSVLVEPLRKLVGGHVTGRLNDTSTRNDENNTLSTVIYLRDLLRYVLCLAVRPPWSMSENMAFFYRVTESWKKDNNVVGVRSVALRNDNLLGAIHAEIDMFPGTFNGKKLTSAVERFAGIEDNKHQKTNGTASNMSHQYDLRTLMGCQELNTSGTIGATVQCSPFMFPLSLDVYTHFDERNSRAYLSWILNFAFGIYGQLKALEEMIKGSACVRNASQSKSDCPSLPTCPGVLTALYQSGSSFMDQGQLANKGNNTSGVTTTKKTCNDLHTVLGGLFNCNTNTSPMSCSPLHNLIVQCEAFLWSIRFPFSLVQLSLWSVAILFISYVFVVPLDHFKIKSHLFNRLKYTMHPSLLIADGQRRVSEVAYFSL